MDAITWIWRHLHWLVFEFPKPDNLAALVQQIGPIWVYTLLTAIVFSETGLLIGFFLPGDSLLFAAGLLASQDEIPIHILTLNILLMAAAVIGDAVNYSLGWQMGERVFDKGRFRFIKHDHLIAAKEFYDRHGGIAIVLARFVPLVRTFTPFVAGVARMSYPAFAVYNVIGGIGWVLSMTMAGYYLGRIEWISKNFEKVVLLIVFISVLPLVIGGFRHWRAARAQKPAADVNRLQSPASSPADAKSLEPIDGAP